MKKFFVQNLTGKAIHVRLDEGTPAGTFVLTLSLAPVRGPKKPKHQSVVVTRDLRPISHLDGDATYAMDDRVGLKIATGTDNDGDRFIRIDRFVQ